MGNVTRREAAKVSAGYAIAGGVMSFGFAKAEGSTIIKGAREMEIDRYRLTPSVLPGRPNISHAVAHGGLVYLSGVTADPGNLGDVRGTFVKSPHKGHSGGTTKIGKDSWLKECKRSTLSDRLEAERRAIANFGHPHLNAAQFGVRFIHSLGRTCSPNNSTVRAGSIKPPFEDRAGDPDLRLAHVDSAAQGPG